MIFVDWLFVAKEVKKDLPEPCILLRENGIFALLAYTKQYPTRELPLPSGYLSNGREVAFKDRRQADAKCAVVPKFMRPTGCLPYLSPEGLRPCQFERIPRANSYSAFPDAFCQMKARGWCDGAPPLQSGGQKKEEKETGPRAIFARNPVRRSYGCRNNVRGPSRRRRSLVCRRSTTASLSHEKVRRHGIGSDNFTQFRAA